MNNFRTRAEASVKANGFVDISDIAAGVDIADVIGMFVSLKKQGHEYVGLCPFHADRTPSLTVAPRLGKSGRFHCFPCGADGDVVDFVRKIKGCDMRTAVRFLLGKDALEFVDEDRARLRKEREAKQRQEDEKAEKRRRAALEMWKERKPAAGSPVEAYLRARKIVGPVDCVHFAPRLYNAERSTEMPTQLAAVLDAKDGFMALHRTYLARATDGRWTKAALQRPKMILGRFMGGHIPIYGTVRPGCTLYVAEGIETAMSVRDGLLSRPALAAGAVVWAAGSLANMSRIALPSDDLGKCLVGTIVLCMDADMASPELARTEELNAELNYGDRGVRVLVAYPPKGMDFNDLAKVETFDRHGATDDLRGADGTGEVAAE